MKKIISSTRLHLLLIAGTLVITTFILSISAYLTDKQELSDQFTTPSEEDFGITMDGSTITNHDIMPGDSIVLNPTITNDGSEGNPVYIFMQTEMDSDFQIPAEDFDDRWQKLSDNTYYYCASDNTSKLGALDSSDYTTPFTSIKLSEEVDDFDVEYNFKITAYAIQTKNVNAASPSSVWELAKEATPVEYNPTGD